MEDENTHCKLYINFCFSFWIATVIYALGMKMKFNIKFYIYNFEGECCLAKSGSVKSVSSRGNSMGKTWGERAW